MRIARYGRDQAAAVQARSSCLRLPRRLRLGQIVQVISVAADSDIPTGELYDALGNIQAMLVVARRIVRRLSFLKRLFQALAFNAGFVGVHVFRPFKLAENASGMR